MTEKHFQAGRKKSILQTRNKIYIIYETSLWYSILASRKELHKERKFFLNQAEWSGTLLWFI
jgi:hypothetical protein